MPIAILDGGGGGGAPPPPAGYSPSGAHSLLGRIEEHLVKFLVLVLSWLGV